MRDSWGASFDGGWRWTRIGGRTWSGGLSRIWVGWLTERGAGCVRAYIASLIGPGDRKSIQPMAARLDTIAYDRLHHFIGAGLSAPIYLLADQLHLR